MVVGFCLVSPLVPDQEPKRAPDGHGQSCGSWEWQKDVYSADNSEFIYIAVKSEKNGQDHEILLLVLRDQQKPVLLVCRAQQTVEFGLNLIILRGKNLRYKWNTYKISCSPHQFFNYFYF